MKIKDSLSRKTFLFFNSFLLLLLCVACAYPLVYVLFASLSEPNKLMAVTGVLLKPAGFSWEAYKAVLANKMIFIGYRNTIVIALCGTSLTLFMTTLAGYFFSRRGVMHQKKFMLMIIITMFFSGGLIPSYLVNRAIGLENNLLALIIPGCIGTTNILIVRTAFYGIPASLEESAKIDGAGHWKILVSIVVPLALPTLAVIALYSVVGHWNSWFNAAIYIRNRNFYPLQLVLREVLIENTTGSMIEADSSIADRAMISETIKYASIMVSTLPILAIYPFLQKYFVNGVMIGAVKE